MSLLQACCLKLPDSKLTSSICVINSWNTYNYSIILLLDNTSTLKIVSSVCQLKCNTMHNGVILSDCVDVFSVAIIRGAIL